MKRFILQVAICWRSMCGQIRPDLGAQSSVTPRRPKTSRINGCNSRVGRVRGFNRLETRTGVSTSPIFLLAAPFLCHKVSAHAVSWACALICGLRWVLARRAQHLSQVIAWNCLGSPHVGYKHLPVLIYGLQVISTDNHSTALNQKYSGLIRRCLPVSRLSSPNLKLLSAMSTIRHHPQLSACGSIRNAVPGLLSETRHAQRYLKAMCC